MVFKNSFNLVNEIKVWFKKCTKSPLIIRGLNKDGCVLRLFHRCKLRLKLLANMTCETTTSFAVDVERGIDSRL